MIIPDLLLTASRPAISLPRADEVIKTAAGFSDSIICKSASAAAPAEYFSQSPEAVITLSTPNALNCVMISAELLDKTTATDSPAVFANVANSAAALEILPPLWSTKKSMELMPISFLLRSQLIYCRLHLHQ